MSALEQIAVVQEPRPETPATLQCGASVGQDPRSGAQAVTLQFVLPRPTSLSLGVDPFLARLLRELAVLGPAIASGDVLVLKRNGAGEETVREHVANALQILRAGTEAVVRRDGVDPEKGAYVEYLDGREYVLDDVRALERRLELALELLEPDPLPDTRGVEQMVAAAMAEQHRKGRVQ